jgi:N-acetylmuramoyl-L-alanine amidase
MSGAVGRGVTNIVVQGRNVSVYKTGGWVTMVDLDEGNNEIAIVAGSESTNYIVKVARKPKKSAAPQKKKEYKKLPYAADFPRALVAPDDPMGRIVVVDPGHGGSDTGAVSPHGFLEKDANLLTSLLVRDELASLGYKVALTREDDSFPALYDRPKLAHKLGADAFVSIHHNAPPYNKDPRALRYHTVYSWNPVGEALSKAINGRMAADFDGEFKSNGSMHANFAVTRNPEIPSCLVEVDFVTSPEGEEAIWNVERRRKVAKSIALGIDAWCGGNGAKTVSSKKESE